MRLSLVIIFAAAVGSSGVRLGAVEPIDFNRDVRPILSDKCFRCHGPDEHERKGGQNGLRLDTAKGALEDLGGGGYAIVPENPEKSELLGRVTTDDDDEIMPPRKTGKALSAPEIEVLRRWIAGGASYAQHWSYEKPRRAALPVVKDPAWSQGAVDRFILARLDKEGLRPQPEADRAALARRVALDLTGIPPSQAEVDALVSDARPEAYEQFVDRQLAQPTFGEHWARSWLDLARYADSKGYADDQPRSIWKYRDYVIDALNANMPFDQFTVEQLAGDLLPNPTEAQLVATGFHRNTMNNTEGGTDDEEFRSAAVVDRVNTTMAVWMGTSMACAQCHTHKYDPLTHKEYFQLYAIFNQSEDADKSDETPLLEFYTEPQKKQRLEWEAEIAALSRGLIAGKPAHGEAAAKWAHEFPARISWRFPQPGALSSTEKSPMAVLPDGSILVSAGQKKDTYTVEVPVADSAMVTALQLEALPHDTLPASGPGGGKGNFVVTRVRAAIKPAEAFRRARYVRVELPGKERSLHLAEVQVFSGGENVAPRGVAAQSSTVDGADAGRAIDGRTEGDYTKQSVTQTGTMDSPSWELDLRDSQPIERVVVWGRTGADATPAGLRVSVLDEDRKPVWEQAARGAPNPSKGFDLGDPVEMKLIKVVADFAQPDLDESFIITDAEPKAPNPRKRTATKKGWGVEGSVGRAHTLALQPEKPFALKPGEKLIVTVEQQSDMPMATLNHFRVGLTVEPGVSEYLRTPPAVIAAIQALPADVARADADVLLDYYVRQIAPEFDRERKRIATLRQSLDDLPIQSTPIMRELAEARQRKTHIQLRGNFMALGEEVTGGVPAVFPPLPPGAPVNRLALARWLVDENNPLTARVLANRLWEAIFGIGLVRTAEEFGSQGEVPSHPELLDWLATEVMATKWDTKGFLKTLVMSAAYRQSSKVTADALAADPENRLLSRGPRFRLGAETVRDQALAVSGLLSPKTHGPSSRPFQPAFDLKAAFGSGLDWKASTGEDRFRRGLYTEWRRSSPYPSMVTFDAPNREVCTLRRTRSNTPLQALVTLNDPVYVEAAQALARRIAGQDGSTAARARAGFQRVLARVPTEAELAQVVALYESARARYAQAPDQAAALIANPDNPAPPAFAPAELAAWTAVANTLLNLDEFLMKR